ncbi:hypothetical protein GYMLUDRAFT_967273 [Collybiopsis luxurians FD-317 M1]|uniref:Helicase ATP-binding domain-containing protein n=1 Tax=Collybiopsis luxurians FD-317 M1 TaxID=944289 RepID=A0A0D0AQ08_9AGAR|nr:hypothetical protein GYMLUDRAFT_967273 [Collybiopsis luxurians FD-317 M1]
MHLLSSMDMNQRGISRLSWSTDRHTLSIDGFPVHIPSFIRNLAKTLSTVTDQVTKLFRNCPFQDILTHIDQAMIPDSSSRPRWFIDRMSSSRPGYSFLEEEENGFKKFRPRLLQFLVQNSEIFIQIEGKLVLNRKRADEWFSELNHVVEGLYYLIMTTWGGGPRGTEIAYLQYANRHNSLRNAFFINGFYTIVTEYSKTQSIKGPGQVLARTPAYQVNRLLILIFGVAHYAAGFIGCFMGMEKVNCSRYFYEVFVRSGRPMKSRDFSKVLGDFNTVNAGVGLQLTDFRQVMSCLLLSATYSSFDDLENEDPEVIDAHKSFNHSVAVGRAHYGREQVAKATNLAPDAVALMQQVCLRWQAFIRLIHPILQSKIPSSNEDAVTNPKATNSQIESLLRSFAGNISERLDSFELRQNKYLSQMFQSFTAQLTEKMYDNNTPRSYQNLHRAPVHSDAVQALKSALRRRFDGQISKEQAELLNSVGSLQHVFGVLEPGAGKSLAFLCAPFLLPHRLFFVVTPRISLISDWKNYLIELGIQGGVYGQDELDPSGVRLVFVPIHIAGTEPFYRWVTSESIKDRVSRLFIDEAHCILTDGRFHQCLKLFRLIATRVPVTFLSSSLMPRTIPDILTEMKISDLSFVDEIRRYTGRPNLKLIVERQPEPRILDRIESLVQETTAKMKMEEHGIIYAHTMDQARFISSRLGCPIYSSNSEHEIEHRWMVSTEVPEWRVGSPVRFSIHANPQNVANWFRETAVLGRDGLPSTSYTIWSQLPSVPLASDPDYGGKKEMISLLQTPECIRLACASLDRVAYSCNTFGGELCSNCEQITETPYHLSIQKYHQPLAPSYL